MATSEIIFKAIRLINPTAEMTITENDLDTLVWLNGTTPISKSDIEAQFSNAETAIANEKSTKEANKANAKAKLIAGEPLTEDEADTIVL